MSELGRGQDSAAGDALVDRAKRLFRFLGHAQQLKSAPPRTVDAYASVIWLAELPQHAAITTAHRGRDPEPDEALFSISRISRPAPPVPRDLLAPWLNGTLDDPGHPPTLRDSIDVFDEVDGDEEPSPPRPLMLDRHPDVRAAYERWLADWRTWANQEQRDRPVRDLYSKLFKAYVTVTGNSEELELVAGVGCLAWLPAGHDRVKRHLLTVPVIIDLDDDTGRLTVERVDSPGDLRVELDMLDPGLTGSPGLDEVKAAAQSIDAHPFRRDEIGPLVRRLVHILDGDGEYLDVDKPPETADRAVAAFAPAIMLRKRSRQGIVELYRTIVRQVTDAGRVPDGLLPLVDPDHVPSAAEDRVDGALVTVDDEPFLPLPVNAVQLRIIRQVDAKAQTLVQGPPGTGKTHTAAALLSHLLAQGKRVLVTAHTDRALKEVRDKLPAEIKPLSVAVVGTSREDMSDLKVAVSRIAASAAERDPQGTEETIKACHDAIDRLRRQRAALYRRLLDVRADEVREQQRGGLHGTLAAIAQRNQADGERYRWLTGYETVPADSRPPLDTAEIVEWCGYLRDDRLSADEPESRQRLLDLARVPDPAAFAASVAAQRTAAVNDQRHAPGKEHPAYDAVHRLTPAIRQEVRYRLHELAHATDELAHRQEGWIADALSDVRTGRGGIWQARGRQIEELIRQASPPVRSLGQLTEVVVTGEDLGPLVGLATGMLNHLDEGGKVKTEPGGAPKIGVFAAKPVKHAAALFERVRVDGLPPTTREQLSSFIAWAEATRALAALDRAWPDGMHIPAEDTLQERLQWHVTEFEQLNRLLQLGVALVATTQRLADLRLPRPVWTDLDAVRGYAALVDVAEATDALAAATQPLRQVEDVVADAARWVDVVPAVHQLSLAARQGDPDGYATAYRRLERLAEVRRTIRRRDALGTRMSSTAPALCQAIEDSSPDPEWDDRLAAFDQAWEWAARTTWLSQRQDVDVNALQAEVTQIEERIRDEVERLAATRAWSHAVSPERLTGRARANLEQYAYLVRRHGKGTGKYAAKQRLEIRQAMDRCRPAVPVWIMPIYRIAEQLQITPNMFDVVIVDEASQAGLEATFLQYLAPKIVVIGDDKQVSPAAVGVDEQKLRDLARQYLADDPYRASWQDPKRSLFDEAKMRFHGLLTLVEHRRCVPEIIGFSNRIAYEPDGVRLIPVRQYGSERLEPVRPVFVPEGYVRGTTNKVNPGEVDAVVDQIEKCLADPRYDGLTFGVISLLGRAQADAIEKKLLERVPPAEWTSRDLRCGDSADFQGSERDVMFLSMVAAPEPQKPLTALTRDLYVQRYNVAASRAKDQMWLFHSVATSDLGNPEDMRFQLLDYCYGVVRRANSGGLTGDIPPGPIPPDRRVEPFDSLFEQRVFNRLYDRGYTVIPQYPVEHYRIDLVVIGPKTRLAIECDGDAWHGPSAYERDLARQRDLERCGWRFFRIRESAFYVDEPTILRELWETLAELDIHPSGSLTERTSPTGAGQVVDLVPMNVVDVGARPEVPNDPDPDLDEVTYESEAELPDEESEAASADQIERGHARVSAEPDSLAPYEEFDALLPPALEASRQQLVEGIRAIVAVEGPVLGHRLHSAYVKAAGGQRVGKAIAKALNLAISSGVRQGLLAEDNPLGEVGVKPRTYRLPHQPAVRLRQLGARPLEEMPPHELALLLSTVDAESDWQSEEALYRATLERLGLKRLTPNVVNRLSSIRVLSLVDRPGRFR